MAGIAFHPRHASQQHKGKPDYALAAELVEALDVPVVVSGGLLSDEAALHALEASGAEAVMLARGSFGNPWRFERLLGLREGEPSQAEVLAELRWVIERAEEHLGTERAGATCASSTRGTPSGWSCPRSVAHELSTAPTTQAARACLERLEHAAVAA